MRIVSASLVAAPLLARLHAEAFAVFPGDVWDKDFFDKMLSLPTTRALIAEDDSGDAAGFIMWQHTPDTGEIMTLAVAPAAQGQGVGAALVKTYEHELQHDNIPQSLLDVADDNALAQRLYSRLGYSLINRRPHYYKRYADGHDHRVDALVMKKDL